MATEAQREGIARTMRRNSGRKAAAGRFRYAGGETPHVGDVIAVDAHPEWGELKVRAVDDQRWHVVASNREVGAKRIASSACSLVVADL